MTGLRELAAYALIVTALWTLNTCGQPDPNNPCNHPPHNTSIECK